MNMNNKDIKYRQGKSKNSIIASEFLTFVGFIGLIFLFFLMVMYNLLK
jgi:hypothetical protein